MPRIDYLMEYHFPLSPKPDGDEETSLRCQPSPRVLCQSEPKIGHLPSLQKVNSFRAPISRI